jgi:hypothetical protein
MNLAKFSLFICVMLAPSAAARAKGWRGLVPMKSTRADVKQLLGTPIADKGYDRFELEEETVSVEYVRYPCELKPPQGCITPPPVCALPPDTVLAITVRMRHPIPLSTLHLDLSKYEKRPGMIFPNGPVLYDGPLFYYEDEDEGYMLHVLNGEVVAYRYYPTKKDGDIFRCTLKS